MLNIKLEKQRKSAGSFTSKMNATKLEGDRASYVSPKHSSAGSEEDEAKLELFYST